MRERINRLAKGIVDAELPKLFLSPEKAEEVLGSGTVYKRELYLASENNLYIKGLAYSNHSRVRILNHAFGGLRNHIVYEVDTSWCENGDLIKGAFTLVTNSGELEVPFLFRVETAASVQVLTTLNSAEDFAELAKKDMDMALRLMEYRDFTDAPFLKDLRIRTIYEGLKGHGNRQNALEEFFLALGVKEPIELTLSAAKKTYEYPSEVLTDKITLRKNTWGYIYIELKADGDFIELGKRVITQADFENDRMDLRFKIHPERMHKGKNLGAIHLLTAHGSTAIQIEAIGDSTIDITGREHEISKAGICRYMKLREQYEASGCTDSAVLNKIQKELDAIRGAGADSIVLTLLQAETYLDGGRPELASACLEECRDGAVREQDRMGTLYCYYQYLLYRAEPSPEKKEAVLRLFRKKLGRSKGRFYLQLLQLKLEPELLEESEALYESFKAQYAGGCRSPFLYLEACLLLEKKPELLKTIDNFELHVLYYGARKKMIGKDTAMRAALLAPGIRFYHRLYYRAMELLYKSYPEKELLSAVCCLLIKGNVRGEESFSWYEKGIKEEISLTRLFEYYLYSLPKNYEGSIPKQVLLYFSYENSQLDRQSRAVLYKNVLEHVDPESSLYQKYEREMEQFAMEELFAGRIDSCLAVIYKHMIYQGMVDGQVAKVLPGILCSNRICCEDDSMKYVVVLNQALTGEEAYPLNGGVAYVPLFFDDCVILFQDTYGNRYMDVSYTKEPVLEEKELEQRCFEAYPRHPMLRMKNCLELMERETLTGEEILTLQKDFDELPLKPLYQQRMLTKIIGYYRSQTSGEEDSMAKEGAAYLLKLDKEALSRPERIDICETLIVEDYLEESYEMIRKFGEYGLRMKRIARLCSRLILKKEFGEEELLLHLAWRAFAAGNGDTVILDYLCEHYNGSGQQMYRLLTQAVKDRVETYDLEERLLAQLLFTGCYKHLDTVFDLYASRKETGELIVKAYFTVKCVGYFLQDQVPSDKVFAYLEGAVKGGGELRKIPEIYLLALAKYYSGLPKLTDGQQSLARRMMDLFLSRGMVFAWFKKLAAYTDLPGDILDKEIIEYHGAPDRVPVLRVRVLPDEEDFHEEEMRMVYKGIYVKQKVLFEGEIMEYEIYEEENGALEKKAEGELSCPEVPAGDKGNRFSALNAMSLYLGMKDEEKLKDSMIKYAADDRIVEKLFPLME